MNDPSAIAVVERAELVGEWDAAAYAYRKEIELRLRRLDRLPLQRESYVCRCGPQQLDHSFARGELRGANSLFVQPPGNGVERVDLDALTHARLVVDQRTQFGAQRVRQRFGKRGEENASAEVPACEERRAMQSHNRLARAGRSGHARGSGIIAFHTLALRRVQEQGPLFPWIFERTFQFLPIAHGAEAAQRVRVGEGIDARSNRLRDLRSDPRGQIE